MKLPFAILIMLPLLGRAALAQTTQPAEPPTIEQWNQSVQHFGEALAIPDNEKNAAELSADCSIRSFKESSELATLTAHTAGLNLIFSKGYIAPVMTLAADVTNAVSSDSIPSSIKDLFLPANPDAAMKADLTAQKWLERVLSITKGQYIGVIIYLKADTNHSDAGATQAFFVLVKGEADSSNAIHITQVVFGDPQQAASALR
jgi:hypothetical protein